MALDNPIKDMLLRTGVDQQRQIDLQAAFGDSFTTFTLSNANNAVVGARIEGNMLILEPGAHGHADLVLTASGEGVDSVSDNFRVRVASENAFTIAVLPDTQNYTSNPSLSYIFSDMTQWLVDHADSKNIDFVIHVGDITENNLASDWAIAEPALRILDGKIPYSILPGNHDQAVGGTAANHSSDFLDDLFSPEKQAATNPDTFGGAYDAEPGKASNTYHTFTAPDGTGWLVLSLEFAPRQDVVRWASEVIEEHLDHRVIIASHTLTNYAGRSDSMAGTIGAAPVQGYGVGNSVEGIHDGEGVYRELSAKYPNVTMVFSGHVLGDSAETNLSYSQHGNQIAEMLVDYQGGSSTEIANRGGAGAMRLITIDPDTGTIYTETYMTDRGGYFEAYRGQVEIDRDGLLGAFRDHQEVITGFDLGPVAPTAQAKAGQDLFLTAEDDAAAVTLDAGASLNPDLIASYEWLNQKGEVIATGALADVTLEAGRHRLTLQVTDINGKVTADEVLVEVLGAGTLMHANFNTGDLNGWGLEIPGVLPSLSDRLEFDSPEKLGLPSLGEGATVMNFPRVADNTEGFLIRPEIATGLIKSYTLAMDLYIDPQFAGQWFSLLQAEPSKNPVTSGRDDSDMLINRQQGIGISGNYQGRFEYGQWNRLVLTFEDLGNGTTTVNKYLNGDLVGTQNLTSNARWFIDAETGFMVFSDQGPTDGGLQTQPGAISSLMFSTEVLSADDVKRLGAAPDADGIATSLVTALTNENTLQFDFTGDQPLTPTMGMGSWNVINDPAAGGGAAPLPGPVHGSVAEDTKFGSTDSLGIPDMPGGADGVMEIPAASPSEGYLVKPEFAEGKLTSYTYIVDVYAPAGRGHWMALLQTDPTNASDADFLVNMAGGLGINGTYPGTFNHDAWQRIALVVTPVSDTQSRLEKYIDGVFVGEQLMPTSRYTIDAEKGFMIFSDDGLQAGNWQTVPAHVGNVFFSDQAMSRSEIEAIGGATAGGILPRDQIDPEHAMQFTFDAMTETRPEDFSQIGDSLSADHGQGSLTMWRAPTWGTKIDSWQLQGTLFAPGATSGEAALHDRSDNPDRALIWSDPAAKSWSNYRFDIELTSTDNDLMGVYVYYQDNANHYKITLNNQTNTRQLVQVKHGTETVLATASGSYRFNDAQDLSVIVQGDQIIVLLDGHSLFGGPVTATRPLTGGTIGVISENQKSTIVDNVTVQEITLTADGVAPLRNFVEAGSDLGLVTLDASLSYGPNPITEWRWLLDGEEIANGKTAQVSLPAGSTSLVLEVTDSTGKISRDTVQVDIVGDNHLMMRDDFEASGIAPAWRILDEGDIDGPTSDWNIRDGRLFQDSNIYSNQLVAGGPNNPDVWSKGWSPLGDGNYILRKGTTAIWDPAGANTQAWRNYSIEAEFKSPDDDGLGFVFYFQDPDNHYKLELDQQRYVWTLVRVKGGIEEVLDQAWGGYSLNTDTHLRVDILDNKIMAYVNGEALFPYPIEDRGLESGTFGLYSWGSEGLSYDNVRVVSLDPRAVIEDQILTGTPEADRLIGAEGDDQISGLAGDDLLVGAGGDDLLDGGLGNDTLDGGLGDDALYGGAGDDLFIGGAGQDEIDGGEGQDMLDYSASNDDLIVDLEAGFAEGESIDRDYLTSIEAVRTGAGNDEIRVADDTSLVEAGAGYDSVRFGASEGETRVELNAGTITRSNGPALTLTGVEALAFGDADDQLVFTTGTTRFDLDAGAGENSLRLTGQGQGALGQIRGIEQIRLDSGEWSLSSEGADVLFGAGPATLVLGADTLADGSYRGQLIGFGPAHSLKIDGMADFSRAEIGPGNLLTISGTSGSVSLELDPALDYSGGLFILTPTETGLRLAYDPATPVTLRGNSGHDDLAGGNGADLIDGGAGDDVVNGLTGDDQLRGGSGNDAVFGGEGNDTIDGGSGDDHLTGGFGNDLIKGGSGNDHIYGGAGNDQLYGGSGEDTFYFTSGFGRDVIRDFDVNRDRLDFDTDVFASYEAMIESAEQQGRDVVITAGEDMLILENVKLDVLSDANFW